MTMHLHHPALSLNGKRKGKRKFRNAEQAKKSRELNQAWLDLKDRWNVETENRARARAFKSPEYHPDPVQYRGSSITKIPSLDTGHKGAVSSKPSPVYTGTKIIGIGTMHKSNAVPIFSDEEAVAISSMRR